MVELGKTYTDKVTGYTGEATARIVYKYDPPQAYLEGGLHDGKPVPAKWFNECRLVEADDGPTDASAGPAAADDPPGHHKPTP